MQLHQLKKFDISKGKRVGRGESSGKGKTSGRGTKGQKSRSGHRKLPAFFEGGQMPLVQRLPKKRGFKKINKEKWEIINIEKLNLFPAGSVVDKKTLLEKKLIKSERTFVKVLGQGEIEKKLQVTADAFSKSAINKIKKSGGSITKVQNLKSKEKESTNKESQKQSG